MAANKAWPEKAVKSSMSKQLKVQLGWAIAAPMTGSRFSMSISGRKGLLDGIFWRPQYRAQAAGIYHMQGGNVFG